MEGRRGMDFIGRRLGCRHLDCCSFPSRKRASSSNRKSLCQSLVRERKVVEDLWSGSAFTGTSDVAENLRAGRQRPGNDSPEGKEAVADPAAEWRVETQQPGGPRRDPGLSIRQP